MKIKRKHRLSYEGYCMRQNSKIKDRRLKRQRWLVRQQKESNCS